MLALPSLALATVDPNLEGGVSFTSSGTLLPVAPKWAPDAENCQLCSKMFTCCLRRHHCRACGRLCCRPCSRSRLPLAIIGYLAPVRVCALAVALVAKSDSGAECFFILSPDD